VVGGVVEQVLVPVLIMIGATLLVMLAIPLGFLAVSGTYFARRTASWLVPLIRRSAADARRSTRALGQRTVHSVVHSRLPKALVTGAVGCALALPAFAAPVRDLEPGWGRSPEQRSGSGATESAAQIGECCSAPTAGPAQEQPANQVRSGPAPTLVRPVKPVDQCTGSCGQTSSGDQSKSKSKSKSDGKSKKKSKDKG
jgi:hypothetical protein